MRYAPAGTYSTPPRWANKNASAAVKAAVSSEMPSPEAPKVNTLMMLVELRWRVPLERATDSSADSEFENSGGGAHKHTEMVVKSKVRAVDFQKQRSKFMPIRKVQHRTKLDANIAFCSGRNRTACRLPDESLLARPAPARTCLARTMGLPLTTSALRLKYQPPM